MISLSINVNKSKKTNHEMIDNFNICYKYSINIITFTLPQNSNVDFKY